MFSYMYDKVLNDFLPLELMYLKLHLQRLVISVNIEITFRYRYYKLWHNFTSDYILINV